MEKKVFTEEDFETVKSKKEKGTWPLDYTSTKGLWPYIKRLGDDLVGIEIGTSCAESTYLLLEKCPNIKKLYTVDCYLQFDDWIGTIDQDALDRQRQTAIDNLSGFGDRVEMIRERSLDVSAKIKTITDKEEFDFIFVDGDHSYEGVLADCEAYYPLLKKGGFFCGHDYSFLPDVKRGVDDFRTNNKITAPLNLTLNTSFFWYK